MSCCRMYFLTSCVVGLFLVPATLLANYAVIRVVSFSSTTNSCSSDAKPATAENIAAGKQSIRKLTAGGQSSTYLFPAVSKDRTGYIDTKGQVIIPHRFEEGHEFSEGLAAVLIDGKWGYINVAGEIVIKPAYWQAGNFSDGMACIQVGRKYGYVNKQGNLVVKPKYDKAGPFSEGFAVVRIGRRKTFFIDKTGKPAITPDVYRIDFSGFSEGLVFAYTNNSRTPVYLDKEGKIAISLEKDKAGGYIQGAPFSEGLAAVKIKGKWGYIDKTGTLVIPPQYERRASFRAGVACVATEEMRGDVGYWTHFIIDRAGKTVKELPWRPKGTFSEGLVPVSTWSKEKNKSMCGYIDTQGTMAIQPQLFDNALPFRNGLARVKVQGLGRKIQGNDAYIDKAGQMVWVGEPRRNERVTTYSGKSMVDVYLERLREEDWRTAQSYIQKMNREELVEGCLKTLEWLLEDPKRTESSDVGRDGAIGLGVVGPFFQTYCRSFVKEEKPIDPTPFRKMLVDKSLDIDFRKALADCYGHPSFYATSWEQLDDDVKVLCTIVRDSAEDAKLREEATASVFRLTRRLYSKYRHETMNEDVSAGGKKAKHPDIVGMLSETPCPFTPEQKSHWEMLVNAMEKATSSALVLYEDASNDRIRKRVFALLEGVRNRNLVRDKTLVKKIEKIRTERDNSRS